jgi:hypothetical protein
MKIKEFKNKLKLDLPKFQCDKPLTSREIAPFENRSFFTVFVGQPRSGKTSHMISSLTSKKVYSKVFNHIYLFMPNNSRKSLKKDPFRKIKHKYDELSYVNLKEVLDQIDEDREKWEDEDDDTKDSDPPTNLILIDDMTVFLKVPAVEKLLTYMILNRRHLRLSIMITVQYYNSLPMPIRKNISSIVLANKPVNSKELNNILEELFAMNKDYAMMVLKYAFQKPYDKLHVILEPLTYYRNLNRLEIEGTELF